MRYKIKIVTIVVLISVGCVYAAYNKEPLELQVMLWLFLWISCLWLCVVGFLVRNM